MTSTTPAETGMSALDRKAFQADIEGKHTDLFILRNALGMEVAVTNYGCALISIMVPDRHGEYANVVMSHDSIDGTIHSPEPFLSTTIGRYGNRIAGGKFTLFGEEYTLTINNGPNSLHGGPTGFHARVWDADQIDGQTIIFKYHSADGEEGFPGNLDIEMCYHLADDSNSLEIEYKAVTINADYYIPIDEVSIPTGEVLKVEGTPMDFRTPHTIGERIDADFQQLKNGSGYDHCYVLNKVEAGELSLAAICTEPISGRSMEVYTTEGGVQLYTGNWLGGFRGTHGATFPARSAICFEAQCFPDTPNKAHFPSAVLMPDDEYRQKTIYKFGVIG